MPNRVREIRARLGLSQSELAQRCGISRQAVGAIESEAATPGVTVALRISAALGTSVEGLFGGSGQGAVRARALAEDHLREGERVLLTRIGERRVARRADLLESGPPGMFPASGTVRRVLAQEVDVETGPPGTGVEVLLVAGCDTGLGLLAGHARRGRGVDAAWQNADNKSALTLLARGGVHAAAVHVPEAEATAPEPEKSAGLVRIHFARSRIGFVVRQGNPLGFGEAGDLGSGRFRLVNRPCGAGARSLLDERLRSAGVAQDGVPGYEREVAGHLQVCEAVASGTADVGVATENAAQAKGLEFLPVRSESCDLWFPASFISLPAAQAMLDTLQSDAFRWDLAAVGSYDVARTGDMYGI